MGLYYQVHGLEQRKNPDVVALDDSWDSLLTLIYALLEPVDWSEVRTPTLSGRGLALGFLRRPNMAVQGREKLQQAE